MLLRAVVATARANSKGELVTDLEWGWAEDALASLAVLVGKICRLGGDRELGPFAAAARTEALSAIALGLYACAEQPPPSEPFMVRGL